MSVVSLSLRCAPLGGVMNTSIFPYSQLDSTIEISILRHKIMSRINIYQRRNLVLEPAIRIEGGARIVRIHQCRIITSYKKWPTKP